MSELSTISAIHSASASSGATARIALAGNPNCGKTALFNALTGGKQRVGNYPGVTVERKEGSAAAPSGATLSLLDLPGTYSLDARTPDEMITRDVILGRHAEEPAPRVLIAVADATSLERNLGLILELRALGIPSVLALNMMDLAEERGLELDLEVLSRELGMPVIPTVAVKRKGIDELLGEVEKILHTTAGAGNTFRSSELLARPTHSQIQTRFAEVDRIVRAATRKASRPALWTDRIDRVLLHPLWGSLALVAVLVVLFQAIFTWASLPMDLIKALVAGTGSVVGRALGDGALSSLLVDGIIAGVGSVLVFLPQILLLFLFILILEDSGYMARAAFLMDRLMGRVGLHGRAFIPLLSSFACAIPGIMATRTIENRRDRLATILVAPLMTCSARLPVYSLLIAAFIPNRAIWGPLRLQGLVMFGLYAAGIVAGLVMAMIFRGTILRGPKPPLLMELPTYKWPSVRGIAMGLWERARLFLRRAGTVILTLSVLLWFLASYPKPPESWNPAIAAQDPAISYSLAGRVGHALEPLVRPVGFNWRIAVAMIPGFAAREIMVGALGTVYAVERGEHAVERGEHAVERGEHAVERGEHAVERGEHAVERGGKPALEATPAAPATANATEDEAGLIQALGDRISKDWSLATALSLLVWYILAMQCLSTLAVTRRETNSWRWPAFMLAYLTVLAYGASFVTYRTALWLGWG
jgi:ferrous iron transport protein B